MTRILGRRRGGRRGQRLAAEDRQRIASLGGTARGRSLQLARRIEDNFRYADAIAELQGPIPGVIRLATFDGPLPGIYPAKARAKR